MQPYWVGFSLWMFLKQALELNIQEKRESLLCGVISLYGIVSYISTLVAFH